MVHPDPYTAIQNALQFYAPDDIVISTFPETRSGWLRGDLIGRVQTSTGKPVEHVVSGGGREADGGRRHAAGHAAHDDHHGPPAANVSSRVEAQFLGMLLFIISEIMLFGAFFTAYFFIRVVGEAAVAGRGRGAAGRDRRRQHRHPAVVELHDALGARGRAHENRRALRMGLLTTVLLGLTFLTIQVNEYVPHRLRAPRTPRARSSTG